MKFSILSYLILQFSQKNEAFATLPGSFFVFYCQTPGKAGLEIVPFDAGFFASIPCDNPDEISRKLEKEGLFIVPLAKGLRVSVASVSEAACRKIPAMVKKAMAE